MPFLEEFNQRPGNSGPGGRDFSGRIHRQPLAAGGRAGTSRAEKLLGNPYSISAISGNSWISGNFRRFPEISGNSRKFPGISENARKVGSRAHPTCFRNRPHMPLHLLLGPNGSEYNTVSPRRGVFVHVRDLCGWSRRCSGQLATVWGALNATRRASARKEIPPHPTETDPTCPYTSFWRQRFRI